MGFKRNAPPPRDRGGGSVVESLSCQCSVATLDDPADHQEDDQSVEDHLRREHLDHENCTGDADEHTDVPATLVPEQGLEALCDLDRVLDDLRVDLGQVDLEPVDLDLLGLLAGAAGVAVDVVGAAGLLLQRNHESRDDCDDCDEHSDDDVRGGHERTFPYGPIGRWTETPRCSWRTPGFRKKRANMGRRMSIFIIAQHKKVGIAYIYRLFIINGFLYW